MKNIGLVDIIIANLVEINEAVLSSALSVDIYVYRRTKIKKPFFYLKVFQNGYNHKNLKADLFPYTLSSRIIYVRKQKIHSTIK